MILYVSMLSKTSTVIDMLYKMLTTRVKEGKHIVSPHPLFLNCPSRGPVKEHHNLRVIRIDYEQRNAK